jgi:ISXO2-like transposase domain
MTILEFIQEFPDTQSCEEHFKLQREKEGVICKQCKGSTHFWLKGKKQWQCRSCSFRTTLRSGTMMENSKLSFHKWYIAMAFMSFTKKGISAKELQRQLKQKRYEPVWALMHKIRIGMGKRDAMYDLKDMVEFDEGYFTIESTQKEKSKTKAGRGSTAVQNVAVMAESTPLENMETGKLSSHCRYFKMKVLESHKAEEINEVVQGAINIKSIVFSDQSTSYFDIADYVEGHMSEKSTKETTATTLKWVHIAISNAKRTLLGIYHKIKGQYLQNYLSEFCYKLNRRYFGNRLFDRLTLAIAKAYR